MELWLPYGETEIPIRIPDDNFYRILEPKKPSAVGDVRALVENALENPLSGYSLNGAVKPGATAGIVVDPIVPLESPWTLLRTRSPRSVRPRWAQS